MYQGKDLEGIALAKEVAGRKPTDITTLGNLDKVFVTANEYKASTTMFEEAFKGIPTEDIGALWYFSVLRTQDAKALFAIALKLHSMFKGPNQTSYLFWAIIALHLQMASSDARDEPEEKSKAMRLAEKMILRAFAPERIQDRSLDELLLLIITLQATENYQEALRVLDEASGIKFPNSDERSIIRAELLEKSGNAVGAAAFLQNLLREKGIFDWGAWKLYVKVIGNCGEQGETASLTAELPEFLQSIKAQTDARSYLLAWVDAGIIFQARFCPEKDLIGHIGAYIEAFKDRACCLPDVQHICQSLGVPLAHQLAEATGAYSIENLDDLRKNFAQFRCARLFRLRCQDGQEALQISASADISRLTAALAAAKVAGGGEGDSELFSLVHLHLATLHVDTFNVDAEGMGEQKVLPLLHALSHAHQALLYAPENFAIKLLLIMIYLHLGNMTAPLALFRSLNIKQLQLDTLAFLISDHILELGDLQHAETFFHESFYIYDENRMSSWSLIAETLSRGSYANAPEFYEFARRLEYSMQAVACICGTIKTEMITKDVEDISTYLAGLKAEELIFDAKFIKNLSDNRDRDVLEFADHGGSVRRRLLDTLPTFGQVSMLAYTFLPIFFRSLLTHDLDGLQHLLREKFPSSLALIDTEHASRREGQILEFVQKLFAAAAVWLCGESSPKEPDYAGFSVALADLVVESGLAAGGEGAKAGIPNYSFFSDAWGRVELYRWLVLTIAFAVRGESTGMVGGSGRTRKSQKAKFQPAIDSLEAIATTAVAGLRATADGLPIVPPDASEIAFEAWEELLAAWKKSLKSYEKIYEDTVSLLRALR